MGIVPPAPPARGRDVAIGYQPMPKPIPPPPVNLRMPGDDVDTFAVQGVPCGYCGRRGARGSRCQGCGADVQAFPDVRPPKPTAPALRIVREGPPIERLVDLVIPALAALGALIYQILGLF